MKNRKYNLIMILFALWSVFSLAGCSTIEEAGSESSAVSTDVASSQEEYTVVNTAEGVCITQYNGNAKELVLPCEIGGIPVTEIGDSAFQDHDTLESVIFPDTLEKIGQYAFAGCINLTDVSIPASVSWIGSSAFGGAWFSYSGIPWLAAQTDEFVIVGNGVLIKYNGDKYEDVVIPEGVHMITDVFAGKHALKSVILPDSLYVIGESAFYQCMDLQSIKFPSNLQRIERAAFEKCACLQVLEFPLSLEVIAPEAFCNCHSLTKVMFLNDATQFSLDSFEYTPVYDEWAAEDGTIIFYSTDISSARSSQGGDSNASIAASLNLASK